MTAAEGTDFQAYLESICSDEKYLGWQDFYTPTDALHSQRIEKKQPPRRLNLSLMVQTIVPPREGEAPGEEKAEKEQDERLEVLAGLRKYADNHLLLVGKPGSGKSTALERLLWEEAEKARQNQTSPPNPLSVDGEGGQKIPVLVELRRYKNSVLGIIGDFLFQHGCRLSEAEIEQLLWAGRFLLLVDGWNELPDDKARGDVKIFREKYQRLTPMIFTTRELAGDIGIEKKLEMQPLTEAQMRQFVLAYLPEAGERLLQQLQGRLRELGKTPLLLWMLCELFDSTGNIPPNLGLVFRCFAQSYDSQIKQDVSKDESRERWSLLLQHLAFEMMRGKTATDLRVTIPKQEAEGILTRFLTANQFDKPRECAFNWLNDLLKYHLIQLKNINREIEFHHQLLQEYYAAESLLVQLPKLGDDTLKRDYLNYLKWTEPLALMLALVEDEEEALRVVKLALEVDLRLGARLAGEVKLEFQEKTVNLVVKLETPPSLKIEFLSLTRSEKAVPALVAALDNGNYFVQRSVVKALGKISNEQAITALVSALNDENLEVCRGAVLALGEIGNEQATAALIQVLYHQKYDVGEYAALALGKIGNEQATAALIQALNSHCMATLALGKIGNEQATKALVAALNHQVSDVRASAALALGEIRNEQVVPALLVALNDEDCYVRIDVAQALGKIGNEQAIPALLVALNDEYSDVRNSAAKALGKIGNEQAIPALLAVLNDEDFAVHSSAIKALGEIGHELVVSASFTALNDEESNVSDKSEQALVNIGNEQTIYALIQALNDEESEVRQNAALALGESRNKQAIPALIAVLNDEDYYVRWSAALALGAIGHKMVVPALVAALNDEEPHVRQSATEALVNIGNKQVTVHLLKALDINNEDPDVRSRIVEVLGNIGGEQAIPALIAALSDQDYYVRGSAALALGNLGNDQAISALIAALSDEDYYVRGSAALALGNLGNDQAIPALAAALNDKTYYVCRMMAEALASIGNDQANATLVQVLNHQNYYVRLSAALALGNIGTEEAIPILVKALNDENSAVRLRAADILGNMGNEQAVRALIQALNDQKFSICEMILETLGKIGSPELLPILTPYLETKNALKALEAITEIQNHCQYYNYEIYKYPR